LVDTNTPQVLANQNAIFAIMKQHPGVTLPPDGLAVMLQAQKLAMSSVPNPKP